MSACGPETLRATILLTALTVTLAGCATRPPASVPTAPRDVALAVVTWNTAAGRGDLGRLVDDLTAGRLTPSAVGDYVLLLQESDEREVADFARARNLHAFYSRVRERPMRTSGNAIVSTRPLQAARAIALPRERQPRTAAAASIDLRGTRLFLVSAHLENRLAFLRGLFGDRARGRQAEALLAALPAGEHGVLGGDMNTMLGPNEPAWRAFLTRFPDTPDDAKPTFRERLVLDHLFFDLPDTLRAITLVVRERYGSDHHPVLGMIS